jgi:hypothetical protein
MNFELDRARSLLTKQQSLAQRASQVPSSTLAYGPVRANKRLGLQAAKQDAGIEIREEIREVRDAQS